MKAQSAAAWVPCQQGGVLAPKPIQREAPAYPPAVRAMGIEGSVEVALTVLRDGSVGWVRVVRAEPRGYFEQAAAEGVRRWRFAPDGRIVAGADAFADFIPATSGLERELQILAAVQECTSREVLPEPYRSMDRSEVFVRLNELRALLKT